MIALDEPHLRLQALSLLLTRLERGELVTPDDGGLNERALQRLRSLPLGELARLAAIKHLRVGILVDGDSLDHALRTLDRLSRESTLLERCVAHHAPRVLLAELFGPRPSPSPDGSAGSEVSRPHVDARACRTRQPGTVSMPAGMPSRPAA